MIRTGLAFEQGADREAALQADDLELLATAALVGIPGDVGLLGVREPERDHPFNDVAPARHLAAIVGESFEPAVEIRAGGM